MVESEALTGGCPAHRPGSGPSPYYRDDLYALLSDARRHLPVYEDADLDYWIVTKYEDVLSILNDQENYSAENVTQRPVPMHEDALKILQEGGFTPSPSQASIAPPHHTRIRNATNAILNVKTFAAVEKDIRRLTIEALDRLKGKDRVNLLAELTYELPAQVIFLILGIPHEDARSVKSWAGNRTQIDFSPSSYEQQIDGARNLVEYWKYCKNLVQDRLHNRREDFTSRLLNWRNDDDSILTLNEIATLTYSMMFAGHETTTNQLTNAFRELMIQRDAWDAICAKPALIPNVVEEALRLVGAVIHWRRRTKKDVEISGVRVPAGANIMLSLAAANRDETMFPDPDILDVERKNARKQLTLGSGIHVCAGAGLARLEMKIVLEEVARRYPDMRLAPDQDINHLHTYVFRAPTSLWVDLGPLRPES
jgi:cytochrome P450